MLYKVEVTGKDGVRVTIDLCNNEMDMQRITVGELKDKIFERIPGSDGKLVYFIYLRIK